MNRKFKILGKIRGATFFAYGGKEPVFLNVFETHLRTYVHNQNDTNGTSI